MYRITLKIKEVTRGRYIIGKTSNWSRVACHVVLLPLSNEANEEVAFELAMENLREEVKI